jgi:hypothetical protein
MTAQKDTAAAKRTLGMLKQHIANFERFYYPHAEHYSIKAADLAVCVETIEGLLGEEQGKTKVTSMAHYDSPQTFLRSLAQNDYMIDTSMLPDGARLGCIADFLDNLSKGLMGLAGRESNE